MMRVIGRVELSLPRRGSTEAVETRLEVLELATSCEPEGGRKPVP